MRTAGTPHARLHGFLFGVRGRFIFRFCSRCLGLASFFFFGGVVSVDGFLVKRLLLPDVLLGVGPVQLKVALLLVGFLATGFEAVLVALLRHCCCVRERFVLRALGGAEAERFRVVSPTSLTMKTDIERSSMLDRTLSFIAPHEAYNLFITESIIFLDACTTRIFDEDDKTTVVEEPPSDDDTMMDEDEDDAMPTLPTNWAAVAPKPQAYTPEGMLPGSAWLDISLPLTEAAAVAHRHVMKELTPDHAHKALILFDDVERARALHTWLIAQGGCRRVLAVSRADLKRTHGFLFYPGAQCLRLPNEICPGRLYLGPASSANEQALKLLGITAVVSLLDRHFHLPDLSHHHKLIRIADTCGADLDAALRVALPFIHRELAQPNGRVLVHCEAGQSRSSSVVVAALMAMPRLAGRQSLDADDALALVREQRPIVRPNAGFMEQLRAAAWMDAAKIRALRIDATHA